MISADRLRELLASRGWSQARLARVLNVSPPAIQQILSGKTKNSRLQQPIARLFGTSEAWLTGESDSQFESVSGSMTPEELAAALKVRMMGGAFVDEDGDLATQGVSDVHDPMWLLEQISRVDPTILDVEDEDFYPPVTTIEVVTDAMAPTILKGDRVLVSLWSREIREPDGIWLLSYGGLKMLRRLMPLPDGGYRVSADNQASPTFEAPESDVDIRGRAFWVGRPLS